MEWDEVVAKGSDEERHDDEENHDSRMHGHKHVVAARDNRSVHCHSRWKKSADDRELCAGEAELPADAEREGTAEEEEG